MSTAIPVYKRRTFRDLLRTGRPKGILARGICWRQIAEIGRVLRERKRNCTHSPKFTLCEFSLCG